MRIEINEPGPGFIEVIFIDSNTSVHCGSLNKEEAKDLLEHFRDVVAAFENFIED